MVEMDSTFSKTSGAPKILKFDSNLDLQKALTISSKYGRNFHKFQGKTVSLDYSLTINILINSVEPRVCSKSAFVWLRVGSGGT